MPKLNNVAKKETIPACGLCGKRKKSREKTDCCGNWICNDENDYVIFLTRAIVARVIIAVLRSAVIIIMKNIKEIGKLVRNAMRVSSMN